MKMEQIFKQFHEKLLRQLALDLNCSPADFGAQENVITESAMNEGRRSYSPGRPFLEMATLGGNTVITADQRLHGFLRQWSRNTDGHRLFELDHLIQLNGMLKAYGYKMAPTHHMFLPCREVRTEELCRVRWLYEEEITPFYGDTRFPNAIAYPKPCPVRPDRIAVIALDGDKIMGMAGCSEDAPRFQQIGIDVLPEYRSRGIGAYLVTLLKNRIIEMGDTPFYGTAAANLRSQNIAVKSGFRPAWVETEAVRLEDES